MRTGIFSKLFGWIADEAYLQRLAEDYSIHYRHYFEVCKELEWCATAMERPKVSRLVGAPVRVKY